MQSTVNLYLRIGRRFFSHRLRGEKLRLNRLVARDVIDFVLHDTPQRGRWSAKSMTTVLRSFLGFLFQRGLTTTNLAAAVPTVPGSHLSDLPRFLEAKQVEKVLRCCDRRTKVGKRDYAILLLLARLGLRGGEVARLTLEDIGWSAGELLIRGKALGWTSYRYSKMWARHWWITYKNHGRIVRPGMCSSGPAPLMQGFSVRPPLAVLFYAPWLALKFIPVTGARMFSDTRWQRGCWVTGLRWRKSARCFAIKAPKLPRYMRRSI